MRNNITFKKNRFILWLIISFTVFTISITYSQCISGNAEISVCDLNRPEGATIDLSQYIENYAVGGLWSADKENSGLNFKTGVLNILAIKNSGKHTYTYTLTCPDGNISTASVTLLLGPYLGSFNNGSACSDDSEVNLFRTFEGNFNPHGNGTWSSEDAYSAIKGSLFDATKVEVNTTYHFTYDLEAVGNCPSKTASFTLTVYRAPEPGQPANIYVCEGDDLSTYSRLDLFDRLSNEDPGGTWRDDSNTGQLENSSDSIINLPEILAVHGTGTYYFSYTVNPDNRICSPKTATVEIVIKDQLDLSDAIFKIEPEICAETFDQTEFTASLQQGAKSVPNGDYTIQYRIGSSTIKVETITFLNGKAVFEIEKNNFSLTGNNTVTILSITSETSCNNIIGDLKATLVIHPAPDSMEYATLVAESVCLGKPVVIEWFRSETTNPQLSDGEYLFTYTLNGSNQAVGQTVTVSVTNGSFSFTIPDTLLSKTGETILTITEIQNTITGCSNKVSNKATVSFTIYESIDVTKAEYFVTTDICLDDDLNVQLSGLNTLTDIELTYTVSGANSITEQTLALSVSNGASEFTIPKTLLPNTGIITLSILSIKNKTEFCSTVFPDFPEKTITISEIPETPKIPNTAIEFCSHEKPTLEDLNAMIESLNTENSPLRWFNDAYGTIPLSLNNSLEQGTYWVVKENSQSCFSQKAAVNVIIHQIAVPSLQNKGTMFCGLDNPKISDLNQKVLTDKEINWFDREFGGNILSKSDALQEGSTYYGYVFSEETQCMSEKPLIMTVSLNNCRAEDHGFDIPDRFSPNGDGVNDTFEIPNIGYIYPNFSLEIFNRYGNLLYRGNRNTPAWDGKNTHSKSIGNGIVPNGVYYYILNFNKDNKPPKQGYLYLNR